MSLTLNIKKQKKTKTHFIVITLMNDTNKDDTMNSFKIQSIKLWNNGVNPFKFVRSQLTDIWPS